MKLGLFTELFSEKNFEETLDYAVLNGIQAVEISTGGWPGNKHCNPDELLKDQEKLKVFKEAVEKRGLTISALNCYGNALHPQPDIFKEFYDTFFNTIQLAQKLGVSYVNTFSGCPGDSDNAKYPNWPVTPWPSDFEELLEWQWEEKVIPYWIEMSKIAFSHGIKIALEMCGGFSVHSPGSLLKLRERVKDVVKSEVIGANFNPAHLWWQGIDPVQAVRILGPVGAIYHFHGRDISMDQNNIDRWGVNDTQPFSQEVDRAWRFSTIGFGHDLKAWKDMISMLRLYNYDHVISIGYQDALISNEAGFNKAVYNLKQIM
ncbi:sugar phosphate isomerase/epimerase family protein [Priestia megaterium]|uniref:sugar phosphate isomerase/epimerase family protein n=1 Tax=Priestia megaterium TaxID=1404 RepID=UPI002FFF686D